MSKKLIALLLCVLSFMLLVSCNNNQKNDASSETAITEKSEEEVVDKTTFKRSSEDMAKLVFDNVPDYYTKDLENYIVDVFQKDRVYIYFVTAKGEEFPGMFYIYDSEFRNSTKNTEPLLSLLKNPFTERNNLRNDILEVKDGSLNGQVIRCWITDSKASDFSIDIKLKPDTDFFTSIDLDQFDILLRTGKYNEIYKLAINYISVESPLSYDSANTIKDLLDPVMSIWSELTVEYDELEGCADIYYNGIANISNDIHIVPCASNNDLSLEVGFYNDDWIFFEYVEITALPENIKINDSSSKTEDVMSNGTIYESIQTSVDEDEIAAIISGDSHIIRFSNRDKDKVVDFNISDSELTAIDAISRLNGVHAGIEDLKYRFVN